MYDQPAVNPKQLMPLPPLIPGNGYMPEDLYSPEEMGMVKEWLKATLWNRGIEDFEKGTKGWSLERKAEVAKMLTEIRATGLYPDRIDGNGTIVWGRVLKSHLQLEMEKNGRRYDAIGQEIARNRQFRLKTVDEMITEEV